MSFLDLLFDPPEAARDIDELRETQYRMAISSISSSAGASEAWVREIADEVRELAALNRVLMRMLAEADILDMAKVKELVESELARPKRAAEKPNKPVMCTKCNANGMSHEMVGVGRDWMCRPCARNP